MGPGSMGGPSAPVAPQAQQAPIQGSMYEQRLAQIRQLPPDQQEAALQQLARDYEGEQGAASTMQTQGNAMATSGSPSGQQGTGRFGAYTAAHPLEHIASAVRQYKGNKDVKEAREVMKGISGDKQKALIEMLRAGLGGGQQPQGGGQQSQGGGNRFKF